MPSEPLLPLASQCLDPAVVQAMRVRLLQEIGPLSSPATECFVHTLLSDDSVVESYVQPLVRTDAAGQAFSRAGRQLQAHPGVEASRAALKARHARCLSCFEHEQELAAVAAWVLPVGMFHLAHPHRRSTGAVLSDLRQARQETVVLVEDALRAMRRVDELQGWTLGAVLGWNKDEDCDPDQLARLRTAVHLSQLRLNDLWIPRTGWLPTR